MSRKRTRRSRARENPSTTTWLLIGGGVVVAGVTVYLMTKPSTAAAAVVPSSGVAPSGGASSLVDTTTTPPMLPAWIASAPTQNVTARVGQLIAYPDLPVLPAGWSWSPDPSYVNTAPTMAIIRDNGVQTVNGQQKQTFLAVGPGSVTVPFVAEQHGPGPGYTGTIRYVYNITVTP
jgi:hypothetical protein